jgi:hypothetical protein
MMTISKISEITGIDRRTIKKRLADVVPIKRTPRATYYDGSALAIVRRGGGKISRERNDLQCARLRTQIAKAKFELAVQQGVMVLISESEQWYVGAVMSARQRFLALSRKLAPHVVGLDAGQVEAIVEAAIAEILDGMLAEPRPDCLRQKPATARAGGQRSSTPTG